MRYGDIYVLTINILIVYNLLKLVHAQGTNNNDTTVCFASIRF